MLTLFLSYREGCNKVDGLEQLRVYTMYLHVHALEFFLFQSLGAKKMTARIGELNYLFVSIVIIGPNFYTYMYKK